MLNLPTIRAQFPILSQSIDGSPLIYLDSAATTQKPQVVLDRMERFYTEENANVHRGMHVLAERATVAYEHARATVQKFLHAEHPEEVIFTKSCTEAINLVAISLSRGGLFEEGDRVVLSILEHHSNIVPWLQLKERKGIEILWIDCDDHGQLKLDQLQEFLREGNVKLVTVTAQSNVLGVRPPLAEIITLAHAHGALVLVDAAQSVSHHSTDVQNLDCDFLTFSGHKLYGPTGIGVLYGKKKHLESMPPFLGGGMMIQEVHQDRFTPADLPQKFEAGTPAIAEAVGLAAAMEWLGQFSWKEIEAHEEGLLDLAQKSLSSLQGISILGGEGRAEHAPPLHKMHAHVGALHATPSRSGCVSFTIDSVHPHDLTEILGRQGICLRAGHHCTQPLHRRIGVTASTRLSVGIYNTEEEIQLFLRALPLAVARLVH